MGQKKNMGQEKKARRARRKMKRYGLGDSGFCMDDCREEKCKTHFSK